jgi:hypothetical protein
VQAEYHCWLADDDQANDFASMAVQRVRVEFPHARINLKYLPPGVPVDWIDGRTLPAKWCVLQRHSRPLMTIDGDAMHRQWRKKNHRQKYNRLSRLGTVSFERVTDHARFEQIFGDICRQYDFRQGALCRAMPFATDPLKKSFYLELHRRAMLHATILRVDDAIIASHLGLLSKDRVVHLGINSYAPSFSTYSPGHLLLALLGVHLATEWVETLDLTPGGDAYKEQFASSHDQVLELDIFPGPLEQMRSQALGSFKRSSKALLRQFGWRSADILAALKHARSGTWLDEARGRLARWRTPPGAWVWRAAPHGPGEPGPRLDISRNSLDDVFKYDDAGASMKLGAFIGAVMKGLEDARQLYTFAPEDKLMIACWAQRDDDGSTVLYGLYVHPHLDNDKLVQRFMTQLLSDLDRIYGGKPIVYRGELAGDVRAVVRRCGFSEA